MYIFIIGPARSGTTILGEVISEVLDAAYWIEPKYIWKYKNRPYSIDTVTDFHSGRMDFIRSRFDKFLMDSGKQYFLEKTPSNVFRLRYISNIFPDAHYIIINRDICEIMDSTLKRWNGDFDKSVLKRRLRVFHEVPLVDFFHLVGSLIFSRKWGLWGPMNDQIINTSKKSGKIDACAVQVLQSIDSIDVWKQSMSKSQIHEIKYRDFVVNSNDVIHGLLSHIGFKDFDSSKITMACSRVEGKGTKQSHLDYTWWQSLDEELKQEFLLRI